LCKEFVAVAKITALGCTITVDDSGGTPRDITTDVSDLTFSTPRGVIDVSGLDKTGYERLLGRSDVTGSMSGPFDGGANLAHAVLKTVPTQAGTITRTIAIGFSTGTATAECVISDYQVSAGNDGALRWTAPFQAANGTALAWT
jgi:hypothetical protein